MIAHVEEESSAPTIINDLDTELTLGRDAATAVGINVAVSGGMAGATAGVEKLLIKRAAASGAATQVATAVGKEAAKGAAKGLAKGAAKAIPIAGAGIGITMDCLQLKDDFAAMNAYCKETKGEGIGVVNVITDPALRERAFETGIKFGTNMALTAVGQIPLIGTAATVALSTAATSAFVANDIARPDEVQLTEELRAGLKPGGEIALSKVGQAATEIARKSGNTELATQLEAMKNAKDPAYAEAMASMAQMMQQNGNVAGTISTMCKKQQDGSCALAQCIDRAGMELAIARQGHDGGEMESQDTSLRAAAHAAGGMRLPHADVSAPPRGFAPAGLPRRGGQSVPQLS